MEKVIVFSLIDNCWCFLYYIYDILKYFSLPPGTLMFLDYSVSPVRTSLVIEGDGDTHSSLSSSVNTPPMIDNLHLLGSSSPLLLTIGVHLSVGVLRAEGNTTIILETGASLTLHRLHDHAKGTGCSFEVSSGVTLTVTDPDAFYVTSGSPRLDILGDLIAGDVILGAGGLFTAHTGSNIQITTLRLDQDSVFDVHDGAWIGTSPTDDFLLAEFVLGPRAVGLFHTELMSIQAGLFEMQWGSRLNTTAVQKHVHIEADHITIHEEAVIDVSGGGTLGGPGAGIQTTHGASHGGQGGYNPQNVYGSPTEPTQHGSGNSDDGRGGGIIRMIGPDRIVIDGTLKADGDSSSLSGGGSGGSIWITGTEILGHGRISAIGGSAGDASGGGAGGRISIEVTDLYGHIQAYGGPGSQHGAAGTVYKQYMNLGELSMDVVVDNNNMQTVARTAVINPTSQMTLVLLRQAVLEFISSVNEPLSFQQLLGDNSGLIVVNVGQDVALATSFGISQPYALPCKVMVEQGAQVALPQKVLLTDDNSDLEDTLNLELLGTLANVRQLVVGTNARVSLTGTANTVTSGITSNPGVVTFNQLDVTSYGTLYAGDDNSVRFHVQVHGELTVHYAGVIRGHDLYLEAQDLSISTEGVITADGAGYEPDVGPGRGQTSDDVGSGASHGGSGGSSSTGAVPLTPTTGSLYTANALGSGGATGGANSTGGAGGGMIAIDCDGTLRLDGRISARGLTGVDSGGGGTGGSLQINTLDITGSGDLDVRGDYHDIKN